LLDGDIVIFEPRIGSYSGLGALWSGSTRPVLLEEDAFQLARDTSHWRAELLVALEAGKTVFVFVPELEEAVITPQASNEFGLVNRTVSNLSSIPVNLGTVVPRSGRAIRVTRDLGVLTSFWTEFASSLEYRVYFGESEIVPALTTNTGHKTVGGVLQVQKGHLVVLPQLVYDIESFTGIDDEGEEQWTEKGMAFGRRLVHHLVAIDRVLQLGADATPPPVWADENAYRLAEEEELGRLIAATREELHAREAALEDLSVRLAEAGRLRRLLYETGKPLENAILEALGLLGFDAGRYSDASSEFDAVFSGPEGRFLGEAEGRDNRAIGIDKLSHLERNIQEDFNREEVEVYAKGVLFGNAFRLLPPGERPAFFTEKCVIGARRSGVTLVRTPDLFVSARYLRQCPDADYARSCREALAEASGNVVQLPAPPVAGPDGGAKESIVESP
jgi:hypothetical protein